MWKSLLAWLGNMSFNFKATKHNFFSNKKNENSIQFKFGSNDMIVKLIPLSISLGYKKSNWSQ